MNKRRRYKAKRRRALNAWRRRLVQTCLDARALLDAMDEAAYGEA